jgi:hypothetical protein
MEFAVLRSLRRRQRILKPVLCPRVDLTGVICCREFIVDFVDTLTQEPLRNPDWILRFECVDQINCRHKDYAAFIQFLQPPEGKLTTTFACLPVTMKMHSYSYCPECKVYLFAYLDTLDNSATDAIAVRLVIRSPHDAAA